MARAKCLAYGLINKKQTNLPRNKSMQVCAGYKKHGYCTAFETRGRCNFDHPPHAECCEYATPSYDQEKVMIINDKII